MLARRPILLVLATMAAIVPLVSAAGPPPKRSPSDTSWTYRSKEHGFLLTLPSSGWKEVLAKGPLVGFCSSSPTSPMLAGVYSVKKQSLDEFRRWVKSETDRIGAIAGLLERPRVEEEETAGGDRRVYLTAIEKGDKGVQSLFVV